MTLSVKNRIMLNELKQQYSAYAATLPGQQFAWLQKMRQEAFALLLQQGLPNICMEEWKYTNLLPLSRQTYHFANKSVIVSDLSAPLFSSIRLVFVDGYFNQQLSTISNLPKGLQIFSLAQALQQENPAVFAHFKQYAQANKTTVTALNLSGAADGAVILLEEDCHAGLIELCFYSSVANNKKIIQAHNIILAAKNSTAHIVEHYCGDETAANLTNNITHLVLAEKANIQHIKLQNEPKECAHIGQLTIQQQNSSQFQSYVLSYGANLARNQIHSQMLAAHCNTELYGLFIAKNYQHMDQHTTIEHIKPECTSYEFYRGILFDHARGVFSGNVRVAELAGKSNAKQINNNLLLSPDAEIDTKPELQIYTDDVQCSHGATVGKLDERALFYLRSRGLSLEQAKNLLIYTFAAEVLKSITDDKIRRVLQQQILVCLSVTQGLQEICHEL